MSEDHFQDELTQEDSHPFAFLPRPAYHLRSLPIEYRWEVTRRHPYYLNYWKSALRWHENTPVSEPGEEGIRQAAVLLLGGIGVSGPPLSPETDAADLGTAALERLGMAGLVHPVSNRGLIDRLIVAMPKSTLARVGLILLETFGKEGNADQQRIEALLKLHERQDPGLSDYVNDLIVSIAAAASIKAIQDDLITQLRRFRDQWGIDETRDRSDKYPEYLEAWDLREGWSRGEYDNSQEKLLREVAQELELSLSTVSSRYRSAFELVTGHSYTPARWFQVFGFDKLAAEFNDVTGEISRRRPQVSPTRRDVPESIVTPAGATMGFVSSGAITSDNQVVTDLLLDVKELIEAGRTNEQILQTFELGDAAAEFVQRIRERTEGS